MTNLFKITVTVFSITFGCMNLKSQVDANTTNDSLDINGYSLILSKQLNGQKYFLYGSVDSVLNKNEIKVSDFYFKNDFSRVSDESIFINKWNGEISLPKNAYIKFSDSLIEITFFITLMNRSNWEVSEVPVLTQKINLRNDIFYTSQIDFIFNFPAFNKNNSQKVFHEFENFNLLYKKSPVLKEVIIDTLIDLMGKLLVQSLAGDKKAEEIFLNLPQYFPKWFSGIVVEIYSEQRSSFLYITQIPFVRVLR